MVSATVKNGARFDIRRVAANDAQVRYCAFIDLPGNVSHRFDVEFAVQTGEFHPPEAPANTPAWATAYLHTLLRQLSRAGQRGKGPRKVRQWKAEKPAVD